MVPEFSEKQTGMSWQVFIAGIQAEHGALISRFDRRAGARLQRMEADLAEGIMLKLKSMNYPCLPIHDSFITFATLDSELPEIMRQVVLDRYDTDIGTNLIYKSEYVGPTGEVDMDISRLLDNPTDEEHPWLVWAPSGTT
jgi:hypothetical protein